MTSKDNNKATVFVVFVVLLAIGCFLSEFYENEQRRLEDARIDVSSSVVLDWVDSFTRRDFEHCDSLVVNQDLRLYPTLVVARVHEYRFYEALLNGVVDAIQRVTLVDVNGSDYKFELQISRYNAAELDISEVAILREKFIDGDLDDDAFTSALTDIYIESMQKSCFTPSDDVVTVVAVFTDDGVGHILGTSDFLDLILQESGISSNLAVYESSVRAEVDSVLK